MEREVLLEVYINGVLYSVKSYWASEDQDVEAKIPDAIYDLLSASQSADVKLQILTNDQVFSPGEMRLQMEGNEKHTLVYDLQPEMNSSNDIPELKNPPLVIHTEDMSQPSVTNPNPHPEMDLVASPEAADFTKKTEYVAVRNNKKISISEQPEMNPSLPKKEPEEDLGDTEQFLIAETDLAAPLETDLVACPEMDLVASPGAPGFVITKKAEYVAVRNHKKISISEQPEMNPSLPKKEPEEDLGDTEQFLIAETDVTESTAKRIFKKFFKPQTGPSSPEPDSEEDLDDLPERTWKLVDSLELYPRPEPMVWVRKKRDKGPKVEEYRRVPNYELNFRDMMRTLTGKAPKRIKPSEWRVKYKVKQEPEESCAQPDEDDSVELCADPEEDLNDLPGYKIEFVDSLELRARSRAIPRPYPPWHKFFRGESLVVSKYSKLNKYVPLNESQLEDRLKECTLLQQTHGTYVWPRVIIGNEVMARHRDALKERGITHILNAAAPKKDLKYFFGAPNDKAVNTGSRYYRGLHIKYYGFPTADRKANRSKIIKYFLPTARFIKKTLKKKENQLLICCKRGVEHSATLFLGYLMIYHDMTVEEAIDLVIERRRIKPSRDALQKLMLLNAHLVERRKRKLEERMLKWKKHRQVFS